MNNDLRFPIPEDPKRLFGYFVRGKRQALKIPIRQLAVSLGISASYLRDIELGNRQAPKSRLAEMARTLRISDHEMTGFYILAVVSRGKKSDDFKICLWPQPLASEYIHITKETLSDNDTWKGLIDRNDLTSTDHKLHREYLLRSFVTND